MRPRLTALCLLLLAACAAAGEITFEGGEKFPAHTIAKVRAKSPDYKSFIYKAYGPDGRRVPTERGEGGWLLFTGPAGQYRVEAVAGRTDKDGNLTLDEAEVTVVIGKAPDPAPPGPQPGPQPGPNPGPQPAPLSPLAKKLRDAYQREAGADRAKHMASLAALYAKAGEMDLQAMTTAEDLRKLLVDTRRAVGVPDDALMEVRRAIEAEIREVLPSGGRLNQDQHAAAASLFRRLGAALAEAAK